MCSHFFLELKIGGIAVGNEILGGTDMELRELLLPAAENVYHVLDRLHLTKTIQVSSPHSEAVFANSYPPSSCTFKEDVVSYMKPLLQFFSQIGSPFFINAYPFLAYKNDPQHIDLNYHLRRRLLKKKGTPHRPKTVVRAFIFALFNENLKPGPTSERNFGLFKADGSIAYDIGFTGLSSATSSLLSFKGIGFSYALALTSCAALLLLAL